MKKISTILLFMTITMSTSLFGQGADTRNGKDGRAIKKGFSLLVEIGFPSSNYGFDSDFGEFSDKGKVWGLQIGNRWYFKNQGISAMGFMMNWLSISISKNSQHGLDCATLNFSLFEPGLVYTYALGTDAALDFYYNLQPTILSSAALDSNSDGLASVGFGMTHALGCALRLKALNIGLEYGFGNVTGAYAAVGDYADDGNLGDATMSAKKVSLILGFKF